MSDYNYKKSGEPIRVGDEITVSSISTKTKFIVNGYIFDESIRPQTQIDLIAQPAGAILSSFE